MISQLPDEILHSIIRKLTLGDAVRATLLSHRWKQLAESSLLQFNRLIFNKNTILGLDPVSETGSHYSFRDDSPPMTRQQRERFVCAVDWFLEFYCGCRRRSKKESWKAAKSFEVKFCLGSMFSADVSRWIDCAISVIGVERLYANVERVSDETLIITNSSSKVLDFDNLTDLPSMLVCLNRWYYAINKQDSDP